MRSIDGDGDWSLLDFGHEIGLRSGGDVEHSNERTSLVGWVVVAGNSVFGGVWVRVFGVETARSDLDRLEISKFE